MSYDFIGEGEGGVDMKGRQVLHLSLLLCALTIISLLSFITHGMNVISISHFSLTDSCNKTVFRGHHHSVRRYRPTSAIFQYFPKIR